MSQHTPEWEKEIRQICTYYSELNEGTAGYDLSEEQFQKLFALVSSLLESQKKETIEKVEELKNKFEQLNAKNNRLKNGRDLILQGTSAVETLKDVLFLLNTK